MRQLSQFGRGVVLTLRKTTEREVFLSRSEFRSNRLPPGYDFETWHCANSFSAFNLSIEYRQVEKLRYVPVGKPIIHLLHRRFEKKEPNEILDSGVPWLLALGSRHSERKINITRHLAHKYKPLNPVH